MEDTESMMQALLNDDELVESLAKRLVFHRVRNLRPDFSSLDRYLQKCKKQSSKRGKSDFCIDDVETMLIRDLWAWRDQINGIDKKLRRPLINWLKDNIDRLGLDRRALMRHIKKSQHMTFTSQVADTLDKNHSIVFDRKSLHADSVLIRNIINNETIIKDRIDHQRDFWFIDSGYTNFLSNGKKQWHRLVANHIHPSVENVYFPPDRLSLLPSMPEPWRSGGQEILVVESSDQHHWVFGTNGEDWKRQVLEGLRRHTDRPVVFRSKIANRKNRQSVYDMLKQDPNKWYCVISHSSAAAVEAIWLGIPVITLGQHITNPISRSRVEDINDLYRGPVGDWLCALTYSQFTKQELISGQAIKLMRRYHHV